ncbi:hypothetical protein [Massilia sp. S19_KUP03_FR1]|uniref:hypothetical protein n=1 Tax=Massilia sp. S19_KUP03_FR1 TaxID=3025503 RepID=UPI002FCDBF8F
MMEWIPVIFVAFKALVLGTGMFFAIKWHYDQGKKLNGRRAVLRAGAKVAAVAVLAALAIGLFTFVVVKMTGLNLSSS